VGIAAALSITWVAYRFHFNLSSATSIHLFLLTAIALRWGFLEASIVSLLSVVCLDYFFTQPLFRFYMTDNEREYLRVLINQLRKKIEDDPAQPSYILTESHIGYRFREA
jgi:K+-sensing histidine kinase KdpD